MAVTFTLGYSSPPPPNRISLHSEDAPAGEGMHATRDCRMTTSKRIAYPVDTTERLEAWCEAFGQTGRPIPVSFRKAVPWLKIGERATHYLHTYPGKLLPHIAHFFLASPKMCRCDGLVLDPFAGSGTVALEARLSGRPAAYADTNPLARLITEAKNCVITSRRMHEGFARLQQRYSRTRTNRHPAVVNIEKWFQPTVIRTLARVKAAIEEEPSTELRRLFLATFSATVRRVSNADPRISVPVMLKGTLPALSAKDVWLRFASQYFANLKRVEELAAYSPNQMLLLSAGADARRMHTASGGQLDSESVDLIITSPPYAGAQKYIRASSLSLGWLGLAEEGKLTPLEDVTIGREHLRSTNSIQPTSSIPAANEVIARIAERNAYRASICATYLNEMESAISEMRKVIKRGGKLVLVIGNNEVCGTPFASSDFLREMIERAGFTLRVALVDEIKSRGLMTTRNRTASLITREMVLVFDNSC